MYSTVIKNAKVIDGAGNPWTEANIAIQGDRIAKISRREVLEWENIVDARGLIVAPGFIDSHTHSDSSVLEHSIGLNFLMQGVTTVVTGECGSSVYPLTKEAARRMQERLETTARDPSKISVDWLTLEDWRRKLEKTGIGVNHIPLVGHKSIRSLVMKPDRTRTLTLANAEEMKEMKRLLRETMEDGAFGVSFGLSANDIYPEECIELLKVVKEYGGVFHNHTRCLLYNLRDAVRETVMISEKSGVPGIVSHLYGRKYEGWGKPFEAVRLIQESRDKGVEVVCDVYAWPFAAIANALNLFIPGGAYDERVHGRVTKGLTLESMVKNLEESTSWQEMKKELVDSWEAENAENERRRRLLWEKSGIEAPPTRPVEMTPVIAYSKTHPELIGMSFKEAAEALGMNDWLAALRKVIIDDRGFTYTGTTMTNEEDSKHIISQPWTMYESDSSMIDSCPPQPMLKPAHPRGSACTAMILSKYVRENRLMTLEEAIRKMTSLPAQFHNVRDRGLIKEGMKADITIFDPSTIQSKSTYEEPCKCAVGVSHVMVNGQMEVENGLYTGNKAGKVLRLN